MDETGRRITKIAREVGKFTLQNMRRKGVGAAEFDVIHLVRHNPGITQTQVVQALNMDKGAAAKRVASLENGRSQLLYATEAADGLRNSKAHIEEVFYTWLLEDLDREEAEQFCATLDKLYQKSKAQRKADFRDVAARLEQEEDHEA